MLTEFLSEYVPQMLHREQDVCDALGLSDFHEILELVKDRSDLVDLERVGMPRLQVHKLFEALMHKKAELSPTQDT